MESDIATGHHVRTKHCHQQVNIASPFADAFKLDQRALDLMVGERVKVVEIDVFLDDRLSQMACVGGLLAAETDGFEVDVIDGEQFVGRYLADVNREFVKTSLCRGERDLLLQNDMQQRRKARRTIPQRRRAVGFINRRQFLVILRQFNAGKF